MVLKTIFNIYKEINTFLLHVSPTYKPTVL